MSKIGFYERRRRKTMVDLSKYTKDNIGKLFDYSVLPKNTDEKDIRQGAGMPLNITVLLFMPPVRFGFRS